MSTTLPSLSSGLTKTALKERKDAFVDAYLDSGHSVIKLVEGAAARMEFLEGLRKDPRVVEAVRDEAALSGGRLRTANGTLVENVETAVRYDYSVNPQWVKLTEEIDRLTEERKALEAEMRAIGEGKQIVDEETGEVKEGASKTSKSTYRITLSK